MSSERQASGKENPQTIIIDRKFVGLTFAIGLTVAVALYVRLAFLEEPIRHDEAYTYISYARLSPLNAISQYTLPNNHLLHTLMVKLSTTVFNPWEEWVIRLPALISGMLLVAAMFVFAFRQRDWQTGLWAAVLIAVSSYLVEYSVQGRGYTMVCLFTAVLLTTSRSVVIEPRSKPGWIVFIFTSVAGLATIPTMLYPLSLATVWIIFGADTPGTKNWKSLVRQLIVSWFIILLGTLLWYTPAFLTTGPESILANRFVQSLTMREWLDRLPGWCQRLIILFHRDLPLPMVLMLTGGFLLGCFKTPKLVLASAITVPGFMLLQRVVPEPRVFTFLLVIYLYVAAIGLKEASTWVLSGLGYKRPIITAALFPLLWLMATSIFLLRWRGPYYSDETAIFPEAEIIARFLAENICKDDLVWAWGPSDAQLKYYSLGYGIGLKKFALMTPDDKLSPGLYIVLNRRYDSRSEKFSFAPLYKLPKVVFTSDSVEVRHYLLKDKIKYLDIAKNYILTGRSEMIPSLYFHLRKNRLELTYEERHSWLTAMAELKDRYNSLILKQPNNVEALLYFICYHTVKNDNIKLKNVYEHILKYKFSPSEWLKFIEFASACDQELYSKALWDQARGQYSDFPSFEVIESDSAKASLR